MYLINNNCNGCGSCVSACPVDGAIKEGKPYTIDSALCAECGACVNECEVHAIEEE